MFLVGELKLIPAGSFTEPPINTVVVVASNGVVEEAGAEEVAVDTAADVESVVIEFGVLDLAVLEVETAAVVVEVRWSSHDVRPAAHANIPITSNGMPRRITTLTLSARCRWWTARAGPT